LNQKKPIYLANPELINHVNMDSKQGY
jgi:hypothetical protein